MRSLFAEYDLETFYTALEKSDTLGDLYSNLGIECEDDREIKRREVCEGFVMLNG